MGEEVKKEEPKAEEKKEEEKPEEKKEEEKVKEESKPPSPFVLFVDLHCTGCAKKMEKSIMKIRGVEGVSIDMAKNEVTIKGIVEPQAVCTKITKKTKRVAKVLSPLPPAEGEPIPQVINSQVSGITVVELNVNMHCEACAQQLKKKILKMRGVQTAVTELSTGKVVVTGTMDGNKLVEYVYRRTKKQAKIVPQPEPSPTPEPKEEAEKPAEDQKKEEDSSEAGKETKKEGEEEEEGKKPAEGEGEGEKEGEEKEKGSGEKNEEEKQKEEEEIVEKMNTEEEFIKRMMNQYQYQYQYHPLYVMERIPPPQLFSDENPNACCIV